MTYAVKAHFNGNDNATVTVFRVHNNRVERIFEVDCFERNALRFAAALREEFKKIEEE